ncbi:MAG: hypothetical protein GY795_01855 [Desulfobacterales bacterium]|nr:hypothetical protein [Desulfobacterales bacterium]
MDATSNFKLEELKMEQTLEVINALKEYGLTGVIIGIIFFMIYRSEWTIKSRSTKKD